MLPEKDDELRGLQREHTHLHTHTFPKRPRFQDPTNVKRGPRLGTGGQQNRPLVVTITAVTPKVDMVGSRTRDTKRMGRVCGRPAAKGWDARAVDRTSWDLRAPNISETSRFVGALC